MIDDVKKVQLQERLSFLAKDDILLAFSGGADSALVLALLAEVCKTKKSRLFAVYINTALMPSRDEGQAKELAQRLGVEFFTIALDEWKDPAIIRNTLDRCYYCKKRLFETLKEQASALGCVHVVDGTNHDDLQSYRPGLKAIAELGIVSPLAEVGFTKNEVREYLQTLGLEVAHRPSSPCLATRIPYGTVLEPTLLKRIEKAELYLKTFGFYNVRVRLHGEVVRLEIDREDFDLLMNNRDTIVKELKRLGFVYLTLDLEGFRSGSLDVSLKR